MSAARSSVVLYCMLGTSLAAFGARAQVFYHEDFRPALTTEGEEPGIEGSDGCYLGNGGAGTYPFPDGWLLRNVDNLVPETPSAFVTDAWVVREEAAEPRNCVAISTSWYSPAGIANDWMWTPAIPIADAAVVLSWRARPSSSDFRDGYEVRVMSAASGPPGGGVGDIGNQLADSTVVFSVASEFPGWQNRQVSLAAYAGQSIHIGFRNASNHAERLLIDDVMVRSPGLNLAAQAPALPYYLRMPTGARFVPVYAVLARNTGTPGLTSVDAIATATRDGIDAGTPVSSATVATVAANTSAPLTFAAPPGTYAGNGNWRVRYDVSAAESGNETQLADNSVVSLPTFVGGREYVRHGGTQVGTIGLSGGAEVGLAFRFDQPTRIAGIRFVVRPSIPSAPLPAYPHHALIRAVENGRPGAVLATTPDREYPLAANGSGDVLVEDGFGNGPITLPAGDYVAAVTEPLQMQMKLPTHAARFATGQTWIWWSTNNMSPDHWSNFEDFGVSYRRMPAISLLTDLALFRDGMEDL